LAKAHYEGEYWPTKIDHILDERLLQFIEKSIYLVMLGPREDGYDVLDDTNINEENAKALAVSVDQCWGAIHARDVKAFGASIRATFEAQVAMFPNMLTPAAEKLIDQYRDKVLGWKLSGAGGGGYLVLISGEPIENASQIYIRREID
jgi:galactokinase/mevalonate kinase-like predicted kinase